MVSLLVRTLISTALVLASSYLWTQTAPANSSTAVDLPRIHLPETTAARFLLKKVPPTYPSAAYAAGIQGDVLIRILIGGDGMVTPLALVSGNSALEDAAKKAVSQWRYMTYQRNGKVMEVVTVARVRFRLSKNERISPR
jgi:TonB family protein